MKTLGMSSPASGFICALRQQSKQVVNGMSPATAVPSYLGGQESCSPEDRGGFHLRRQGLHTVNLKVCSTTDHYATVNSQFRGMLELKSISAGSV